MPKKCLLFLLIAAFAIAITILVKQGATTVKNEFESAATEKSLPGVGEYDQTLKNQFKKMQTSRGKKYQPRTRHLNKDGSAKYTNRLFLQTSPYLLQHAHNPVNWYPWSDEAFEMAKKLKRPVLLSVGYSTCHWCHVMEEESFEDPDIAKYMNTHYIAIKVDREERPDVDGIYMKAVQALTGRGGWPMTVWLTPERKPFYGGTYFPARDGDRGYSVGFLTMLTKLNDIYHQQGERVAASADQLTKALQSKQTPSADMPSSTLIAQAVQRYNRDYDVKHGGLKGAPKFPSSLSIPLLLRYQYHYADTNSLNMATFSLTAMANGGIHDHVGGGFHRYATDQSWLVPHFEKMLYDNALLACAYLEAYQITQDKDYADMTNDILHYVSRSMTSPDGAFYSATDADSITPNGHREEGYYFTWTKEEIAKALDKKTAERIEQYYAITDDGNFEGRNILHTPFSISSVANTLSISVDELTASINKANQTLYKVRNQRPAPLRDEKILTAWNGLMISAFAKAGLILNNPEYTEHAKTAADFVLTHLYKDGQLYRSYKDKQAKHVAYLDDYAFFIASLLDLYEATFDVAWLNKAIDLDKTLEEYYEDKDNGGFFMTADHQEKLLFREKPAYDGAIPSGNSVAILNLLRLYEFTTQDDYRKRAEKSLKYFGTKMSQSPTAYSDMLLALDFYYDKPKEIVIVSTENDKEKLNQLLDEFRKHYLPNRILSVVREGEQLDNSSKTIPLLKGKIAQDGKTTAYVCVQGVCELPTRDVKTFASQLTSKTQTP